MDSEDAIEPVPSVRTRRSDHSHLRLIRSAEAAAAIRASDYGHQGSITIAVLSPLRIPHTPDGPEADCHRDPDSVPRTLLRLAGVVITAVARSNRLEVCATCHVSCSFG